MSEHEIPSQEACGIRCGCPPVELGSRCRRYQSELTRANERQAEGSGTDFLQELLKLGAPPDAVLSLKKPWDTNSILAAKKFEAAPRDLIRTLILAGPRGCGKSVAAAHVLHDWAKDYRWNSQPSGGKTWRPAIWANAAEVTAQTDFGRVDPDWLEGLERAQILVVDDLGEDGTTPGLGALTNLLKARHEARKPTVITSNLSLPAMAMRYGTSWYERLKVAAIAPDLRQAKSLRERPRPEPRS